MLSMKSTMVAAALSVLLVGIPANIVAQADIHNAAVLVMRTGCLGSCPSYEAEIHGDGRVVWKGHEDVAVKRNAEHSVDANAVRILFSNYFPRTQEEICVDWGGIDAPMYWILFAPTGDTAKLKRESDDYLKTGSLVPTRPCNLGDSFTIAITELERVANTHFWLHGDESLQDSEKVSADVFFGTKSGFTPLMKAAGEGKLEQVRTLAQSSPVDSADETGWTALMVAASRCRSDVVDSLLSQGANPKALDRNGDSALTAAATAYCERFDSDETPASRYDLIKKLVDAGAKVNSANMAGQTPLMVAAKVGNDDAIRALLDLGANVRMKDKVGMTAKAYAIKYQRRVSKANSDYQREYRDRFRNVLALLTKAQQTRVP